MVDEMKRNVECDDGDIEIRCVEVMREDRNVRVSTQRKNEPLPHQ